MTDRGDTRGPAQWPNSMGARFLVAGSLAAMINWIARFPLERVMPYPVAVLGALVVGMTCGFVLYDRWAFPGSNRPLDKKIRDFVGVNFMAQMVMFGTSVSMREVALLAGVPVGTAGAGAHLIGIGGGALISFLGHRNVTFSKRSPDN
jgi:putative flippase GtrA